MGAKLPKIWLALFWFIWTGVIIPGHTRGIIPLPGFNSAKQQAGCGHALPGFFLNSCPMCNTAAEAASNHPEKPKDAKPAHCAICDFVAKLSVAPVFAPQLEHVGLMEIAASEPAERLPARMLILTSQSRAPPVIGPL